MLLNNALYHLIAYLLKFLISIFERNKENIVIINFEKKI